MASSIQIYITWIKVFIELEIPIESKWNKHRINQLLFCIEIAIRSRSVWFVSHSFGEFDFNEYSNMNSSPFHWKMTIDAVLINLKYGEKSTNFGNSNLRAIEKFGIQYSSNTQNNKFNLMRFPQLFLLIIAVWTCGLWSPNWDSQLFATQKHKKWSVFFQNRDDIFHFDV